MCSSELFRANKQSIFVFFIFCGLFSTVFTVELSSSSSINKNLNGSDSVSKLSEIVMNNFVATTPKIDVSHTKAPSRYEQGLEDYEEAVARVEHMKEEQRSSSNMDQIASIFNTLNTAWRKTSDNFKEPRKVDVVEQEKMSQTDETSLSTEVKDQSEGRYIKGDPLKGYYDFLITEGSYKFWAAFQLFTAGLMIYSTFAAIYYSKVNPIVSDYDYVTYLGGSRSLADDPEPSENRSNLASLLNSHWLQTAAHGFEFVLDAIDRLPQSS